MRRWRILRGPEGFFVAILCIPPTRAPLSPKKDSSLRQEWPFGNVLIADGREALRKSAPFASAPKRERFGSPI